MTEKVLIENDLFDIVNRLKSIDDDYYVMYNKLSKKYEIHNSKSKISLQLVLPYPCLDSRAIYRVYETMLSRCEDIIRQIDRHNDNLEVAKIGTILDNLKYKTKNLMQYLDRGGKELPSYSEL